MAVSLGRAWIAFSLFVAFVASENRMPATWVPQGDSIDMRTAYTSSPWVETRLYGQSPRTWTIAAAVSRCWSSSGNQLSGDYCLEQALNVAFVSALTDLNPQRNITAIGGRDLRSASTGRPLSDDFDIVDLDFDGEAYRPHLRPGTHMQRSQMRDRPAKIRYGGTLPRAMLYQRRTVNGTVEAGSDRPIFVATDGFQNEIAHLEKVTVVARGDNSEESEPIYEASHGIKVQSRSPPITTFEYVQDWMNSDSGIGDSSSMSDYLVSVAKSNGYLGFELNNSEAGRNGKFIMIAESLMFGKEWEANWNWCFTPGNTADCLA